MKRVPYTLLQEYYHILSNEIPEWLGKYLYTDSMNIQYFNSMTSGTTYSKLYNDKYFYSIFDHSIGVALIIWNFTKNKKQTLAGLFHDISSPCFKHCIDFMNGDYEKQESIEKSTKYVIENDQKLMRLLREDDIDIDDICDYHIYPVADNDTPKLSADRLEYTLSNALFIYDKCTIGDVKQIYENLIVRKNENGVEEIQFLDEDVAIKFFNIALELGSIYMCDKARFSMQFIADTIQQMCDENIININDLYTSKESDILEGMKLYNPTGVSKWLNSTTLKTSIEEPEGYSVNIKVKIRYIDPLIRGVRLSNIDDEVRTKINTLLNYDFSKFLSI